MGAFESRVRLEREDTPHLQVFLPAHDLEVPDAAEHEGLAMLRLVLGLGGCQRLCCADQLLVAFFLLCSQPLLRC